MSKDNVSGIGTEMEKWADPAMYHAEEMPGKTDAVGMITPSVKLINMTPDPLGSIGAMTAMYEGRVIRSLRDLTMADRERYFDQVHRTHLKAPFESVTMHFLLEGVTRAFTHQLVRQRTAVYAQESMRFAVKEHIDEEVALPPSLAALPADSPARRLWQQGVNKIDDVYHALVASGIPAEDARGLLPTNITTRVHYITNYRALLEHAGNRLCTQAQFEWRLVFAGIAKAIRSYVAPGTYGTDAGLAWKYAEGWQHEALATHLAPICYQLGKCQFQADFDRSCSIRERVEELSGLGVPSSEWRDSGSYLEEPGKEPRSLDIHPAEWLADPGAAR